MLNEGTTPGWPMGASTMARLFRERKWDDTPLGPADRWPGYLRCAVDLSLDQPVPTAMLCGDDHLVLFNEPFARRFIGDPGTMLGCPLRQIWPDFHDTVARVLKRVQGGRAVTLRDQRHDPLPPRRPAPCWYNVSLSPLRDEHHAVGAILVTAFDTTGQMRVTQALRAHHRRQAYLLQLSEVLRSVEDPAELKGTALRMLGLHLGVSGVAYGEVEDDDQHIRIADAYAAEGAPALSGLFRLDDFGTGLIRALRDGQTLAIPDLAADPGLSAAQKAAFAALGMRGKVTVPLIRGGRLVACLTAFDGTARAWPADALSVVELTAERLWAAVRRIRAESALAASEALFRSFAENSEHVLWMSTPDGERLTYLSPSFDRVFGTDRQQVLNDAKTWRAVVDPADIPLMNRGLRRLLRGEPATIQYRIRRESDGDVRHILDSGFAVRDAQGRVAHLAGIAADVTLRQRMEEALEHSEEQLRTLFSSIEDGYCLIEVIFDGAGRPIDYRFMTANAAFERHTGLQDVVGRTARELVPALETWWFETYGHVARTGETLRFEHAAEPMGRVFEVSAMRVGAPPSQTVALIFKDTTDRKRAEAEIIEGARRFRTLAEGIPQLVWRGDGNGRWTWASPQWRAYTGQTEGESMGWGWLDALHPEDRILARRAWDHTHPAHHYAADYRIREAATGDYRWFQTRAAPVAGVDGVAVEWLGTSTDVDELRAMQERLQRLVAELQHRTRNLMAVIRAVMDRTLATSPDLPAFQSVFRARMSVIARANGLLSRLQWDERVSLHELVRGELAAMGLGEATPGSRVTLAGGDGIRLRSSTVQLLALVFHELTADTLAHGALAQDSGHLRIEWDLNDRDPVRPHLRIVWTEQAANDDDGASRSRFARELIEQALPYQLDAATDYALEPGRLTCTIRLPMAEGPLGISLD